MSEHDELDMSGTAIDTSKLELLVQLQWMRPYLSDSHRSTIDATVAEITRLRKQVAVVAGAEQGTRSVEPLSRLPAEAIEAARHLKDHLLTVDLPWSAGEQEIEIVCTALLALASPQENKP